MYKFWAVRIGQDGANLWDPVSLWIGRRKEPEVLVPGLEDQPGSFPGSVSDCCEGSFLKSISNSL